jgi:signal transduction histidine kinase
MELVFLARKKVWTEKISEISRFFERLKSISVADPIQQLDLQFLRQALLVDSVQYYERDGSGFVCRSSCRFDGFVELNRVEPSSHLLSFLDHGHPMLLTGGQLQDGGIAPLAVAKVGLLIPLADLEGVGGFILCLSMSRERIEDWQFRVSDLICSSLSCVTRLAREVRDIQNVDVFYRRMNAIEYEGLDELLEGFFDSLSKVISFKFASLWLYNDLDSTLVLRYYYPSAIDGSKVAVETFDSVVLTLENSLNGEVILERSSKIFLGVANNPKFTNREFARRHGFDWFVSFPLTDRLHETLGVINIWPETEACSYSIGDQRRTETYIDALASRIRKPSFEDTLELFTEYNDIFDNLLMSKGEKESWDRLAELVCRHMACEGCSIFLQRSDGLLSLRGTTGLEKTLPYDEVVYKPGEGLTGTAFLRPAPIVYYPEIETLGTIHLRKFREKTATPGPSRCGLFSQIHDRRSNTIGVVRCNNKQATLSHTIGRFTTEDVTRIRVISQLISWLYAKSTWFATQQRERERNVNSLHHEIFSPLDGILSHIEWFQSQGSLMNCDEHKAKLKFDDMRDNAKLIEMVVLTMGRFDEETSFSFEPVSFHEKLQTCIGFLMAEAKEKKVSVDIDGNLKGRKCIGDPLQLMRVFYNVLRNAIKYSDMQEPKKYVRVFSSQTKERLQVIFEDNGIGVSPREATLIFEKFQRGSNASTVFPQGTGLGLAYCRSIMARHQGLIYMDPNNLKKPLRVILEFPRQEDFITKEGKRWTKT